MNTFFSHYNSLRTRTDQKELRFRIIKECKIKKNTFYQWLSRGDVPDEKNRLIISEIIGLPVGELFPENNLVVSNNQ